MTNERDEILKKKLESTKSSITSNNVALIAGIVMLFLVPFGLVIPFIGLILIIVSAIKLSSLKTKKEELEIELSVYNKEVKKETKNDILDSYHCEYCDKPFKTEEQLETHYKSCDKKRKRRTTRNIILLSIGFFILLIIVSVIIDAKIQESKYQKIVKDREEVVSSKSCNQCTSDSCTGKVYFECIKNNNCSTAVNKGNVIGKCNVECLTASDCDSGSRCANNVCCVDQCTESFCSGKYFTKCESVPNFCNNKWNPAIVKGECGVNCITDTDCSVGMKCSPEYNCSYYEMNERITEGSFMWTFKKISVLNVISNGYSIERPSKDAVFLSIYVEVENIGRTAETFSPSFVRLIDDQGREFDSETFWFMDSALRYDTINPGIKRTGTLYFEVPKTMKVANVKISSSYTFDTFKQLRTMI